MAVWLILASIREQHTGPNPVPPSPVYPSCWSGWALGVFPSHLLKLHERSGNPLNAAITVRLHSDLVKVGTNR